MAGSEVLVELKATTTEFRAKMAEAKEEVHKLSTEGSGHFAKLQEVGKAALFGIAGAGIAIGTLAVHAAIEGEEAHARLAQAIKNAGGSMEELEPKVDALSGRFAKLGFTNDEVETGLANMTTSLRDPEKAMRAMGLAADLARFKHISLADASIVVAKAMEGQLRPLKQLGIDLPVAAGGALKLEQAHNALSKAQEKVTEVLKQYPDAANAASKHHKEYENATYKVTVAQQKLSDVQGAANAITKGLANAVGGQAAAASETFAGKLEAAKAQAENLVEKLGNALLPVITSLVGKISDVVSWFEKHRTTAEALAAVVGGALVAAITAYVAGIVAAAASSVASFATMVAAGATWFAEQLAGWASLGASVALVLAEMAIDALAWAAEMVVAGATAMLPFLPLIAACAAVAFAAYELYKHWDQVWGFIKSAVKAGWDFIKQHFELIMTVALGPLGLAIAELGKHWDDIWNGIKAVVSTVWGALKTVFGAIVSAGLWVIKTEVQGLKATWDAVWDGIKTVVSTVWNFLKPVFTAIVNTGIHLVKAEIQGLKATWDAVWNGIQTVVSGVWDFLKPIFDKISNGISGIVSAAGKVGGVIGKIGGIIPHAAGGYARSGELALVGEEGPELVRFGAGGMVHTASQTRSLLAGGGGGDIHIHVAGNVLSPDDLANAIHTALLRKKGRGGTLGLA